jgi:hypothetical protein
MLITAFKETILKDAVLAANTIAVDSKLHSMANSGTIAISVAKSDLLGVFDRRFRVHWSGTLL